MPTCCNDLDSLCRAQLNFGSTMVIKTKQKPPVITLSDNAKRRSDLLDWVQGDKQLFAKWFDATGPWDPLKVDGAPCDEAMTARLSKYKCHKANEITRRSQDKETTRRSQDKAITVPKTPPRKVKHAKPQLNFGATMVIKTKQKPPVMRSLQSFRIYHESLEMRFGGIDYDLLNCPMYGSATHLNDGTARELLTQKMFKRIPWPRMRGTRGG